MSGERFQLNNKVAVVTGATGILGKHFVRGLAESGAQVALVDLDQEALESFVDELNSDGYQSIAFSCDVSDPTQVKQLLQDVLTHFKKVDILHNNAASKGSDLKKFFAPTEEYDLEAWREVMSVNLDGLFDMARTFGGWMAQNGGGSIVQTASIYGVMAPDQRIYKDSEYMGMEINTPAVYSASKAGVVGLTKYLAALWAKNGVRVNTLVPGGVESGQNDVFTKKYSDRVPMQRMAKAEEMVGPLVFLASEASSYMTGQTLMVDGGLSAW